MNKRGLLLIKQLRTNWVPPYRTLRCPMVGHQASWCRMLCTPVYGRGLCGRQAPHGLVGRTQRAIKRQQTGELA